MTTKDDEAPAAEGGSNDESSRSATRDLADGLELMLRAARKAIKNVDAGKIEELGRRAMRGLEQVDRQKVQDFGRKAARNLDPRRVEEVAEDAGRELLAVVERVAERIDSLIGGGTPRRTEPNRDAAEPTPKEPEATPKEPERRVRVDTDDS